MTIHITSTLNILELTVILVGLVGVSYGVRARHDAANDVEARQQAGINSGSEILASLLVETFTLLTVALLLFLFLGTLSAFIPSPAITTPVDYFIQVTLVGIEILIAYTIYRKHTVRRGVFLRDLYSDKVRKAALAQVELDEMINHTIEAKNITEQLKINNEHLRISNESHESEQVAIAAAALLLSTETTDNTVALGTATEATERLRDATDRNSGIRDPESHTRMGDDA